MSQGIRIKNNNGQLLISDAATTFYYYGPAELGQATASPDYGGVTIHLYRTYTSKPIIPFIYPRSGSMIAITRVFRGYGGYWEVEVATSGMDSYPPELIIFTTAEAENWDSRFSRGSMTKGIRVKRSDGTVAFDSSVGQPLSVIQALDVIPPYNPTTGGQDLVPTQYNPYYISGSQPMVGFYSMALCEREYTVNQYDRSCTGISYNGSCIGFQDVWARTDRYWAFYHAAVAISGNQLQVGWLTYSSGHQWATQSGSSFDIFIPIIDLGGGGTNGGAPPIVNETINYSAAKVIVADKSFYPGTNYSYVPPPPNPPTNLVAQTTKTVDGSEILSADWSRPTTYPFAYKYQIYVKRSDSYAYVYKGETTTTQVSGPAPYWMVKQSMPNGTTAYAYQRWYSNNGVYWFQVDGNGNLSVWTTNTNSWVYYFPFAAAAGYTGGRLVMQSDGNLVYYRMSDWAVIWQSGTAGWGNQTYLHVNDYGELYLVRENNGAVEGQTLLYNYYYDGDGGTTTFGLTKTNTQWDVKIVSVNSIGTTGGYAEVRSSIGPNNYVPPPPVDYGGGA